jgi:molybdate transport system regulatory protein
MPREAQTLVKPPPMLKGSLALQTPLGAVLSDARIRLLEAIDRVGSLNRAAREVPLSYKAAWDALNTMNAHAPQPLVVRSTGGAGGGGTRLTDYARQLIALYRAMESSQQDVLDRLPEVPTQGDMPTLRSLIRRMTMKTSARNQFATVVRQLTDRGGLIDVGLDLGQGDQLVATITPESVRSMGLGCGQEVHALIKAPGVHVSAKMPRTQAGRNRLGGLLSALQAGATHTGCSVTLPSGRVIQATIPNAEAATLALNEPCWAVFDTDSVVLVTFA